MKKLHVNTGKWSRDWTMFGFFFSLTLAEDPEEKWWRRRWMEYDKEGNLKTYPIAIKHIESKDKLTAWFVYFLMIQLAFAKLQKEK